MYLPLGVETIRHPDGTYDIVDFLSGELVDGDFQSYDAVYEYCNDNDYVIVASTEL